MIYNGVLFLLIAFLYALEACNYFTSAVLTHFYACCMSPSCTPGKSLRCMDLFKYVVNHPGAHGERETKGTVTLPKLTSAMLQTAGPPALKTLYERTRQWLAKIPRSCTRWDEHRKHHSIDVDISTGEWRERNRERSGGMLH